MIVKFKTSDPEIESPASGETSRAVGAGTRGCDSDEAKFNLDTSVTARGNRFVTGNDQGNNPSSNRSLRQSLNSAGRNPVCVNPAGGRIQRHKHTAKPLRPRLVKPSKRIPGVAKGPKSGRNGLFPDADNVRAVWQEIGSAY